MEADKYNQFLRGLFTIIANINQYKDDPRFALGRVDTMNLSNFEPQKLLCCCEEDIWEIIESFSGMSV